MSDRDNTLVRISWRRPSSFYEGGYSKGIFYKQCEEFETDGIIEEMKKKCLDEGYQREILNIEIWKKYN